MNRNTTPLLISLLACLLAGCANMPTFFGSYRELTEVHKLSPGVWRSNGYGWLIDISDNKQQAIQVYNITQDFCIPVQKDQESPLDYVDQFRRINDNDHLAISSRSEPYEIEFHRVAYLPKRCTTIAGNDILENYDAFVQFFAEHYAFFDLYGVDWQTVTTVARQSLTNQSHEGALVETFIGLLSQLKDGHVSISAVIDGDAGRFMANPGRTNTAIEEKLGNHDNPMAVFGKQYLKVDIDQTILKNQGIDILNERIKFGLTTDDIGYMAVMAEGGYTQLKDPSFIDELTALNLGMERVIDYFKTHEVKAVIIDLSVNHGGYDFLSRAIASRFASAPTIAYSKSADDAQNSFLSPVQNLKVFAGETRFTGPVYVLTSDFTVSAGEILTLCLRALPNVTHVGEATRGALSDVLTKYLPNGWEITLSNEIYADHKSILWEGKGIEPEITIDVFNPDNPLEGHLQAVQELTRIISQQITQR